jgi:hypothetical protein
MKVRTFKSRQILLLSLLKSKTEESYSKKKFLNVLIESRCQEILSSFKKSLRILFTYHVKKKFILFIGLPKLLAMEINYYTPHAAFSKYVNLSGGLLHISKYKGIILVVKKRLQIKKLKKKPDLIVLFDHVNANHIVEESYLIKIPLICVNTKYDKKFFSPRNPYAVSLTQNAFQPFYDFFWVGLSFLFK